MKVWLKSSFTERLNMASGSKTPAPILDVLADDEHVLIVQNVSNHKNTSGPTLEKLSSHHDKQVRLNIANHPNTATETLKKMHGANQHNWVNMVVVERVGLQEMKNYINEKKVS